MELSQNCNKKKEKKRINIIIGEKTEDHIFDIIQTKYKKGIQTKTDAIIYALKITAGICKDKVHNRIERKLHTR